MQKTSSHNEETDRTETPLNDIPQPAESTTHLQVDGDTRDEPSVDKTFSPVFNENNKRPRVESSFVPNSSLSPQSSTPPVPGPIASASGSSPTVHPIPAVIIEGSHPKRAMSEEHLSSRSESPVVSLSNGQSNATTNAAATGNTKLSEVTYPVRSTESADADMNDVDAPMQDGVTESQAAVADTPSRTINKGMIPSDRPTLQEQVKIIRAAINAEFKLNQKWYIIPSSWWLLLLHLAHPNEYPRPPQAHKTFAKDTDAIPSPTLIQLIDVSCYDNGGVLSATTAAPGHEAFWRIKEGLREWQENDPLAGVTQGKGKGGGDSSDIGNGGDMVYVEECGWQKITEWYGDAKPPSGVKRETRLLPEELTFQIELNPPNVVVHQIKPSASTEPATASSNPKKNDLPFRAAFSLNANLVKLHADIRRMFMPDDNRFGIAPGNKPPSRLWKLDVSPRKLADAQNKTTTARGETASTQAVSTGRMLPSHLVSVLGGDLTHKFEWTGSDDSKSNNTLSDEGVLNGDVFALEVAEIVDGKPVWCITVNEDGKAVEKLEPPASLPLFSTQPRYTGSGSASMTDSIVTRSKASPEAKKRSGTRGLRGLQNLGNTCFMNSGLQCLSNTPELSLYFTSGAYKSEINRSNPLGMKGQVADKFGALIESIWDPNGASEASGSRSFYGYSNSIVPREFKSMIGRFNHSFAGYGQQDTQELIAFLLDGLHEDLNRIYQKPYIEKPDWKDGGGEEELALFAKECWDGYKKRNDSAIVDLFQGQLKSTLICPDCDRKSITLDPFMYLTVPIPQKKTFSRNVYVMPLDPSAQRIRVEVQYTSSTTFGQLKQKVGEILDIPGTHLLAIDEFKSNIYQFWLDEHRVVDARKDDIVVMHELPTDVVQSQRGITANMNKTLLIPVFSVKKSAESYNHQLMGFGSPFFIAISKSQASNMDAIWDAVMTRYANSVDHQAEEDLWVPVSAGSSTSADDQLPEGVVENVTGLHIAESDKTTRMSTDSPDQTLPDSQMSPSPSLPNGGLKRLRRDLFQLSFASAGAGDNDQKSVFFKGNPKKTHTLEQRQQQKRSVISQVTSAIQKNFSRPGSDDEDEVAPDAILKQGDAIFCEWEDKAARHFFNVGHRGRYSTEESYVAVVDPAISLEEKKYQERKRRGVTLDDCLDEFSRIETLGENDLWYCSNCKKHQAASKQMEIYQLPDILVICMKRFGSSGYYRKIDEFVDFPIDGLDMEDRCDERRVAKTLVANGKHLEDYGIDGNLEPLMYDLYAVDNHYGGLGGGHYTATCKNMQDGKWYKFDDSHVSPAGEGDIKSSAAYLLFYRRRTSRPIGGVTKQKIDAEVSNRPKESLPAPTHNNTLEGGIRNAKRTSGSDSDNTLDDDTELANDKPERTDDVDDILDFDEHDKSLDSLAREIQQDMEDDEMPPAYSPASSPRLDTPDSGFAKVPDFDEAMASAEPGWPNPSGTTRLVNGNAGSGWTHVNWETLGKSAPTVNSSQTSSTADNYVEVDAEDAAQAEDDMVVVEKVDESQSR